MKIFRSAPPLLVAALCFIPTWAHATALSDLTAATTPHSINNGSNNQTWNWNSFTSFGLSLVSSPATMTNPAAELYVQLSGTNATSGVTSSAIRIFNDSSGTTSTNYGIDSVANSGTHNYGIYGTVNTGANAGDAGVWGDVQAGTGATYGVYGTNETATGYAAYFNNSAGGYAAAFMGGNVGIGTATPLNSLDIGPSGGIHVGSGVPVGTSMALYNNSGTLTWNGIALATGSSVSGTTNYIPVFTSASSLGDSAIYQNGSNVGIGTTLPQSLIQAYGGEVQVGSSGASCAAANNGALRYSAGTIYYCTGTTWTAIGASPSGVPGGGFVNKIRNGNMLVSQRLATNTSTTLSTGADAYWIDGWYYHITGTNVSGFWQNSAFTTTTGSNPASIPAYAEIKGATGNTAIDIYQRMENIDSSPLAGQTATVQFQFQNNSGASITPTFQTCYASAVNNFATCTSDVSTTNMQACANNTTCTEAYTFNVSSNAANGYQIQFNFGAMTSSADIIEFTGVDLRTTPGLATGLNSAPPVIEQPNLSAELVRDQRYYQTSYGNGIAPGTVTNDGLVSVVFSASAGGAFGFRFPVQLRAAPTIVGYASDGTLGDWTATGTSSNAAVTFGDPSVTSVWFVTLIGSSNSFYYGHYTASSEL